jgi:hypothetical protein
VKRSSRASHFEIAGQHCGHDLGLKQCQVAALADSRPATEWEEGMRVVPSARVVAATQPALTVKGARHACGVARLPRLLLVVFAVKPFASATVGVTTRQAPGQVASSCR